jgi:predicted dehydrogenase
MLALLPAVVETAEVHAAAEKRPSASASENNGATDDRTAVRRRYTDAIVDTSNVADWEPGIFINELITELETFVNGPITINGLITDQRADH